jgi:uncharacterized oligopeptide transporter (OPT) family protein
MKALQEITTFLIAAVLMQAHQESDFEFYRVLILFSVLAAIVILFRIILRRNNTL